MSKRTRNTRRGRGYTVGAAHLAFKRAFGEFGLREIVSFTLTRDVRSRSVVEKLGMRHDAAGDFDQPGTCEEQVRRYVCADSGRTSMSRHDPYRAAGH
jgi:RimJ/RimL family protein N-acetyltransferase